MTAVLEARQLGKRYRRRWALADCTLTVPAGRVTGLVGPNGAGKTTLLQLAAGLLTPTSGTIEVAGGAPGSSAAQRDKAAFVAQDSPVYAGLSVADHLTLGAKMNAHWDASLAAGRIERLGIDPGIRAGKLSGGQRAQLALTLAIAKRPRLLLLDEPAASLDPLARREFLRDLAAAAAAQELSVVMSSHLVADLEQVCDYLIVLVASRVRLAGDVRQLLGAHRQLTGPRCDPAAIPDSPVPGSALAAGLLPAGPEIISARDDAAATTLVVRAAGPAADAAWADPAWADPAWTTEQVSLESLVLAYMSQAAGRGRHSVLEVTP
jgi:ABC-2 type transport system ATP-binding protein